MHLPVHLTPDALKHLPPNTYPGDTIASDVRSNITHLHHEITHHQAAIQRLEHTILFQESMLSPIVHVPDDILLLVFALVLHGYHPEHDVDRVSTNINSTQLDIQTTLHVCQRWRFLALGSVRLWTTISFDFYVPKKFGTTENVVARQEKELTMWIDRSGGEIPLSVSFQVGGTLGLPGLKNRDALIGETVRRTMPRWVGAHLSGRDAVNVLDSTDRQLPILEKLSLDMFGATPRLGSSAPQVFAPRLRSLRLSHVNFVPNLSTLISFLPWSQLTTLALHELTCPAPTILHLLSAVASSVQRLELGITWKPYTRSIPGETDDHIVRDTPRLPVVCLQVLTCMVLHELDAARFVAVCQGLRVPALQDLVVMPSVSSIGTVSIVALERLLLASKLDSPTGEPGGASGTLKKLTISNLEREPRWAMRRLFHSMPALEELVIGPMDQEGPLRSDGHGWSADEMLTALTWNLYMVQTKSVTGASPICPLLRNIELDGGRVRLGVLADVICPRCLDNGLGVHPLQSIRVFGVTFTDVEEGLEQPKYLELMESLESLRRDSGMDVVIRESMPKGVYM